MGETARRSLQPQPRAWCTDTCGICVDWEAGGRSLGEDRQKERRWRTAKDIRTVRLANNAVEGDNRREERQDVREISSCQFLCVSLHFVCPSTVVCQLEGKRDAPCRLSNMHTPMAGPAEGGADRSRELGMWSHEFCWWIKREKFKMNDKVQTS